MKRTSKIVLGVCGSIVGLIAIIYVSMLCLNITSKPKKTTYEFDKLTSIKVKTVETEIKILKSNDNKNKVEFKETNRTFHKVSNIDGELTIERRSTFYPFDFIFPNFINKLEMTLYLNDDLYINIDIDSVSGNVQLTDINASNLTINAVSGHINAANTNASNMSISSVSGNINLDNLISKDSLEFETVSGKINALNSDSKSIKAKSVSGSINLNLLANKIYETRTISGKILLPSNENKNGNCNLETVSGNIEVTLA